MNKLINVFKLLSDETRVRIIILLAQEELCVCEISEILEVPQPTVSKCLSKLRDLDLVFDERKEKFIYYKLKNDNNLLNETLNNIFSNIEDYPHLLLDKSRLVNKNLLNQSCFIDDLEDK